jgi:hypothetical protein
MLDDPWSRILFSNYRNPYVCPEEHGPKIFNTSTQNRYNERVLQRDEHQPAAQRAAQESLGIQRNEAMFHMDCKHVF